MYVQFYRPLQMSSPTLEYLRLPLGLSIPQDQDHSFTDLVYIVFGGSRPSPLC
jgi:hypothetical protein